jgi:hypothetical protein
MRAAAGWAETGLAGSGGHRGTAFLLAWSSAVVRTSTARPRRPGSWASSRCKNQATRRSRSAPTASGGWRPGGHRSSALAACRRPGRPLACSRPSRAGRPGSVAAPGRHRRRAAAGRRTARPGRIGWQVLVVLARAAGCARVTTQYELVGKAEISPFARSGTSGVRWRAGVGPLGPGDGSPRRRPGCRRSTQRDDAADRRRGPTSMRRVAGRRLSRSGPPQVSEVPAGQIE